MLTLSLSIWAAIATIFVVLWPIVDIVRDVLDFRRWNPLLTVARIPFVILTGALWPVLVAAELYELLREHMEHSKPDRLAVVFAINMLIVSAVAVGAVAVAALGFGIGVDSLADQLVTSAIATGTGLSALVVLMRRAGS